MATNPDLNRLTVLINDGSGCPDPIAKAVAKTVKRVRFFRLLHSCLRETDVASESDQSGT